MYRLKLLGIGLGVVVLTALALPFLIPTRSYIPQIEQRASAALGAPVTIADLSVTLLPLPGVTVHGIEIGAKERIRIESVAVRPALLSLLTETTVLRSVTIDGVRVTPHLIDAVSGLLQRERPAGPPAVRVEHVRLRQLRLDLDAIKWGPLRGDIELDEAGVRAIAFASEDRHFHLELKPTGEGQRLALRAHDWLLPMKPALRFETLGASGSLAGPQLLLPTLEARLYGGSATGQLDVNWAQGWKVQGAAALDGVGVQALLTALALKTRMSGQLHAQGRYTMAAKEPGRLADSLRGSFRFRVNNGVLHGFDLEQAVRSLARAGTRGGQTRFDELSGVLQVVGSRYEVRELRVSSGALSAKGRVAVAPNKALSGTVEVELKRAANVVAVPLDLAGTVTDPIIYPNPAALAGAAAGTVILGPGVGTGLGSKAGQALEKIFK